MIRIKEGIHFYFGRNQGVDNGFRSIDYGIKNVKIGGGMFEEHYIPSREIRETYIKGNPKPYFHGVDFKPIEIQLTFAFENFNTGFTTENKNKALRELAYWLTKPYYIPFGIIGQDTMFYVMAINNSSLIHNGSSQGYVEINLRTDAPWAYSEIKSLTLTGLNPDIDNIIQFENKGDLEIKPEIWADMPFIDSGQRDFEIRKITSDASIFKFTNLLSQEKLYINNEKEYIESLNTTNYHYDNFNNQFLFLSPGMTQLAIKGASQVIFKYQERMFTI